MSETQSDKPVKNVEPLQGLYVNLDTFSLFERPASLFEAPEMIPTKIGNAVFLAWHMKTAEVYILVKRAFDKLSDEKKAIYKHRFMYIRECAISRFGEQDLRRAAKALQHKPEYELRVEPTTRGPKNLEKEELTLLEVPDRLVLENAAKPPKSPIDAGHVLDPTPATKEVFRVPIANPEHVGACFKLIEAILDEVRKIYLFNYPRLKTLLEKMKSDQDLSEKEERAIATLGSGPIPFIRSYHPELHLHLVALEAVIESSALLGAFSDVEAARDGYIGAWQAAMRRWQREVDQFFPTLSTEEV